jgi:hypothetical protein
LDAANRVVIDPRALSTGPAREKLNLPRIQLQEDDAVGRSGVHSQHACDMRVHALGRIGGHHLIERHS